MAQKTKAAPRQKHVPMRTCSVCRENKPKRQLTRLVIGPDTALTVDPGGKLPGRGAYLCDNPACWESAARTKVLESALKASLSEADRETIRRYAPETTEHV